MRQMPKVPVDFDSFLLTGGLDIHTPQKRLKQGASRSIENWECDVNGGYRRIGGYERYDGRTAPSNAIYLVLQVSATAGLVVGDSVNGQTSGATGVVAYIDGLNLVLTKLTGTFAAAENLREVLVVIGTITTVGVAITDQVKLATYLFNAGNIYRSDITAVPGSGSVLGLFHYNGLLHAWRNNSGGTAALLYKETAAGWSAITMPYEVSFTAGSGTQPTEGSTVTKGAVSAVVRRVMVQTGTFGAGTAAGRLIIDAPTGGSFTAGAFTAGITANCSGAQSQVSFLPGGRFEFDVANSGYGVRVYGCDKVNRGFEFDGTYVCPISTGMATDAPTHVRVHKSHLFFSFAASAQHSGTGTPYSWTVVTGAAELLANGPINAFLTLPGNNQSAALAILSNDHMKILYGSSSADWDLVPIDRGFGCRAYGAQSLTDSYAFDDSGVTSIAAVQEFGNFSTSALTLNIRQFIQNRRTLLTDTIINREKSQYRAFFSDGYGLWLTIVNGKYVGAGTVLFPNPATVSCNGESVNGTEVSYFGSTNGFVYKLDSGTSFDGAEIAASFDLAYASQGNDRITKRYRHSALEVQGDGYCELQVGYSFAYGYDDAASGALPVNVTPSYWDQFTWDQFFWDGRSLAPVTVPIDGTAENIALAVTCTSALWPSFVINSITNHYTPRRVLRT